MCIIPSSRVLLALARTVLSHCPAASEIVFISKPWAEIKSLHPHWPGTKARNFSLRTSTLPSAHSYFCRVASPCIEGNCKTTINPMSLLAIGLITNGSANEEETEDREPGQNGLFIYRGRCFVRCVSRTQHGAGTA